MHLHSFLGEKVPFYLIREEGVWSFSAAYQQRAAEQVTVMLLFCGLNSDDRNHQINMWMKCL